MNIYGRFVVVKAEQGRGWVILDRASGDRYGTDPAGKRGFSKARAMAEKAMMASDLER